MLKYVHEDRGEMSEKNKGQFDFKLELANLPTLPGTYIMRDAEGTIIYIGKAVNLKNRVKSYFQKNSSHNEKVIAMVNRVASFEYIITDTEFEALLLECNLIKLHKPQYNILLKDDKGYPYIKITLNEEYPRMSLARKVSKDGAKYFGPFYSNWVVNQTIEAIEHIFPLKTCNKVLPRDVGKTRPCLNYHIGRCIAPCQGGVNAQDYREMMENICKFLSGKTDDISLHLQGKMELHSQQLEFERAAEYRDRIEIVNKLTSKQKVAGIYNDNIDVLGISQNEIDACIQLLFIRDGKAIGRDFFILEGTGSDAPEELISGFLKQFYDDASFFPRTILLPESLPDHLLLEQWLSEKRNGKVEIKVPQKGDKRGLVKMASKNADIQLQNFSIRCKGISQNGLKILEKFADMAGMETIPVRIEAYDVSNTGTEENVASMVVFENGRPNKKEYRKFNIKDRNWKGDVESMREVLTRRLKHNEMKLPDLILADGGILHVNMIEQVLEADGRPEVTAIRVFGMVKDEKHRTRGLIIDGRECDLKKDLEVFRFVTAIQDEAHRFAITYNKKLRDKRYTASKLDLIPGIGKSRKLALLKKIGSVAKIKQASKEELMAVEGISASLADTIVAYFQKDEG